MDKDLVPRGRSGPLAKLDDALLVVVGVVGVLLVLKIVGFIAGTIFFLVKLAVAAAVAFVVLRLLTRSRRS